MSLLLATGILAIGGLGLFMYKSNSDDTSSEDTSSENYFDLNGLFSGSDEDDDDEEKEPESYETKTRSKGSKTKSARKTTGSRRRY